MFSDIYNGVTFNTSVYAGTDTTMTKAVVGGFLTLNSGNSVTAGQGTNVRTYRSFAVYGPTPTYFEAWVQFLQPPQPNNVCEWGFMYASGVTDPTDGVFFRINSSGGLDCVISYQGVETTSAVTGAVIENGVTYHTVMAISENQAQFWFNGEMVVVPMPRGAAAAGITLASQYPLQYRCRNTNTVSTAQQFKIGRVRVTEGSLLTSKPWNESAAGSGLHSITSPPGVTTATGTANYANSAAPANATLANTGPSYTTLGGQWQAVMVAGAETDYNLFGYLNPVGSATIPARNLYVNYVRIGETFNTVAANAATPIVLQWGLAAGSTSTTLAVADSATAGTRSPRRIPIGGQQFATGAPIGSMSPGFQYRFVPPVIVEPGTYFNVILKVVSGTATGNNIRGAVAVSGNWE
jgi:hypothetical protein